MSAYRKRVPKGGWTPSQRQRLAQLEYGYGPITLRREGDYAIVEIEVGHYRIEVIREALDENFCHTIEPLGIAAMIESAEAKVKR